jgi:hypothetical protein
MSSMMRRFGFDRIGGTHIAGHPADVLADITAAM